MHSTDRSGVNAPLPREREHGGVVQEVLELGDGLDDRPELLGAREPAGSGGPDGVDVEGDAALAELEARHLRRARGGAEEALANVPERQHLRPGGVGGGLHGGGLEDEDGGLGVLGAEAEREGVPRVVRQDGEVGRDVRRGRRRERQLRPLALVLLLLLGGVGDGDAEQVRQLERRGAAHGERARDELRAEAEARHVGARLEVRVQRRRGGRGRGVGLRLGRLLGGRLVVGLVFLGLGRLALASLWLRHC